MNKELSQASNGVEDTAQELKNYQLSYLLSSAMGEEDCTRTREELVKALQEQGAHIVQSSEVSKRKLAYPVAKQIFAFAGKILFLAQPNAMPSLNTSLRNEENLLRFVLLKKEVAESLNRRAVKRSVRDGAQRRGAERTESFASDLPQREDRAAIGVRQNKEEMPRKEQEKITIEDIDRKLDEIMKNIS